MLHIYPQLLSTAAGLAGWLVAWMRWHGDTHPATHMSGQVGFMQAELGKFVLRSQVLSLYRKFFRTARSLPPQQKGGWLWCLYSLAVAAACTVWPSPTVPATVPAQSGAWFVVALYTQWHQQHESAALLLCDTQQHHHHHAQVGDVSNRACSCCYCYC